MTDKRPPVQAFTPAQQAEIDARNAALVPLTGKELKLAEARKQESVIAAIVQLRKQFETTRNPLFVEADDYIRTH